MSHFFRWLQLLWLFFLIRIIFTLVFFLFSLPFSIFMLLVLFPLSRFCAQMRVYYLRCL